MHSKAVHCWMEESYWGWGKVHLRWWGLCDQAAREGGSSWAKFKSWTPRAQFQWMHSGGTHLWMEGTYWGWGEVHLRWWECVIKKCGGGRWLGQKLKPKLPGLDFSEHIWGVPEAVRQALSCKKQATTWNGHAEWLPKQDQDPRHHSRIPDTSKPLLQVPPTLMVRPSSPSKN